MASEVGELGSLKEVEGLNSHEGLAVIHFWASWSKPCQQMQEAMCDLAKDCPNVKFYKVVAEDVPEVSLKFDVVAVPTFILLKGGKVVDRVNGAHVPELAKKTAAHDKIPVLPLSVLSQAVPPKEDLDLQLKRLINTSPCMLFMKGTPTEPKCGFSRQIIGILEEYNADFGSFNILMDDEVRQGLKKFSNWPTYPQLYVKGELIGGLDIVKEMKESGELEAMLPKVQSLDERLKQLINKHNIMLFMKGTPEEPRCGFSKTMCNILKEAKVEFGSFDILEDEKVRQGLKKYSNWPTYPQLYANGELVGGLDIVKELQAANELVESLKSS